MDLRQTQTVIASAGYERLFTITCSSTQADHSNYQSDFDAAVNSFEVLNEPPAEQKGGGLGFFEYVIIGGILGGVFAGIGGYAYQKSQEKKAAQGGQEVPPQPQSQFEVVTGQVEQQQQVEPVWDERPPGRVG